MFRGQARGFLFGDVQSGVFPLSVVFLMESAHSLRKVVREQVGNFYCAPFLVADWP